jgi:hypothetical protein
MAEVENAYGSRMGFLDQLESKLRGDMPSYQQEAESQFGASKAQLDAQKSASARQLDEASSSADTRQEDALSAARRLYNELMQAGQQRFGGATSAGQAWTELNTMEQQRRQGDITKSYEETTRAIIGQRQALDERYNAGLMQLQAQKTNMVNTARRDFENKLMEISRMRNEANENKSNMRLQALQDFRNQIFTVNLQAQQFQQQLDAQRQQAAMELNNAAQQFSSFGAGGAQAANEFSANTTTNPTTNMSYNAGGNSQPQAMTGAINRGLDDEYNFTGFSGNPDVEFLNRR